VTIVHEPDGGARVAIRSAGMRNIGNAIRVFVIATGFLLIPAFWAWMAAGVRRDDDFGSADGGGIAMLIGAGLCFGVFALGATLGAIILILDGYWYRTLMGRRLWPRRGEHELTRIERIRTVREESRPALEFKTAGRTHVIGEYCDQRALGWLKSLLESSASE
jgi:hypothetical protein